MHLAVFGGTGNTGRHLIEQALRNGHEVTLDASEHLDHFCNMARRR
jgi:uncharacterized protein YbjT (DUF2867 family)